MLSIRARNKAGIGQGTIRQLNWPLGPVEESAALCWEHPKILVDEVARSSENDEFPVRSPSRTAQTIVIGFEDGAEIRAV